MHLSGFSGDIYIASLTVSLCKACGSSCHIWDQWYVLLNMCYFCTLSAWSTGGTFCAHPITKPSPVVVDRQAGRHTRQTPLRSVSQVLPCCLGALAPVTPPLLKTSHCVFLYRRPGSPPFVSQWACDLTAERRGPLSLVWPILELGD